MELHQLRYFCSVVQAGSFTKAAAHEGVAQPSLSQQIQRLEKSVGAELFIRLGRSVRLTHAGTVFYPYAQSQPVWWATAAFLGHLRRREALARMYERISRSRTRAFTLR